MFKLYATDLDSTLLDDKSQLPVNLEAVIDRIEAQGALIVPASGRTLCNMLAKFGDLQNRLSFISDNGAILYHKNEIVFKDTIAPDTVIDTIMKLREAPETTIIVITTDESYYDITHKGHAPYLKEYYENIDFVDDVTKFTDNVVNITTLSLNHTKQNYETIVRDTLHDQIYGVMSGEMWTDIMNKGVNKAKALAHLLSILDIHKDSVATFGDYYNDLEMIKFTKYGHVVANAPQDLKDHAYRVIGTNDSGAVVTTILEYLDGKIK